MQAVFDSQFSRDGFPTVERKPSTFEDGRAHLRNLEGDPDSAHSSSASRTSEDFSVAYRTSKVDKHRDGRKGFHNETWQGTRYVCV